MVSTTFLLLSALSTLSAAAPPAPSLTTIYVPPAATTDPAAPVTPFPVPLPVPNDWISRVAPTVKLAGSPLDGKKINAVYGGFFIGKDTTLGPCADFAPCDTYTNITGVKFNQNQANAVMDSDAPGQQTVYVAFAGQLSFAFPGDYVPEKSHSTPFTRQEYFPEGASAYAAITFLGAGWVACPTRFPDLYQVSAAGIAHDRACINFEMEAVEYSFSEGIGRTFQYAISPATEG